MTNNATDEAAANVEAYPVETRDKKGRKVTHYAYGGSLGRRVVAGAPFDSPEKAIAAGRKKLEEYIQEE